MSGACVAKRLQGERGCVGPVCVGPTAAAAAAAVA